MADFYCFFGFFFFIDLFIVEVGMCCDVSVEVRRQLEVFHFLFLPCGSLGANPGCSLSGKRLFLLSHLASPVHYTLYICILNAVSDWISTKINKYLANRMSQEMGPMSPSLSFCCGYTVWHQARSLPITSGFKLLTH